jgi:hypothetical protein
MSNVLVPASVRCARTETFADTHLNTIGGLNGTTRSELHGASFGSTTSEKRAHSHSDTPARLKRMKAKTPFTAFRRVSLAATCIVAVLVSIPLAAKEVPDGQVPALKSDWTVSDRMAWNTWRKNTIVGSLPLAGEAARRFYEAFKENLKGGNSSTEYKTLLQRHSMYDAMAFTLHRAEDVDKKLRCIRFFDAATDVTSVTTLGGAQTLVGQFIAGLSADTVAAINEINQRLFEKNTLIMRNLLLNWKEPRDPINPAGGISAIAFDLMMVQFEQSAVEAMLQAKPSLKKKEVIDQVSDLKAVALIIGHYVSGQGGPTARISEFRTKWLPAVGVSQFSFDNKEHRVALGEAYVLFLHGHGLEQYKALRKDRTIPGVSCKGTLP